MGSMRSRLNYVTAVRDFDRARKQASLRQLMARITGKSAELLSYNKIQAELMATGETDRGLREIPLDAIVGSVGRYKDFTRDFLPIRDSDEERWASVRSAISNMSGMKPIEVYQIGEVYFVKDGNHRVSVARQLGTSMISAYVTEVHTKVPLALDDDPDELICKARYATFLERTKLDETKPAANLLMTFCGQYDVLIEQIETHLRALQTSQEEEIPYTFAAADWYDEVYTPVIDLVREQGVLRNFPGLTETDLYVLFSKRWQELQSVLGWDIDPETAVPELAELESRRLSPVLSRVGSRLKEVIVPPELNDGPTPGKWRRQRMVYGRKDRLFADYLVALSGSDHDWQMLDEVIKLAQMESDHLLGLHVVSKASKRNSAMVENMRQRFEARCQEEGVRAEFAVDVGKTADTIIKRAAWADLVVTSLIHPPGPQPIARLGHGFNRLIQRCPRPVLAVPAGAGLALNRVLLAYDGSPKAEEALFVATYLASRWPISLVVVTVETDYTSEAAMDQARRYVDQFAVKRVEYVMRQGSIADAILETAAEHGSNQIIMGGFGFRPVLHMVLGSTVDRVLREFGGPILICR